MDKREKQLVDGLVKKTDTGEIRWVFLGEYPDPQHDPLVAKFRFGEMLLDATPSGQGYSGRLRVLNSAGSPAIVIINNRLGELRRSLMYKLLNVDEVWAAALTELAVR